MRTSWRGSSAPGRVSARLAWWGSGVALIGTTAVLLAARSRLDKVHIALAYLLIVLTGSAAGGRTLGILLSGAAFLAFNFLFLPPYYTLQIADPFDWFVLASFLVTGVVAAQLLSRAQRQTAVAKQRADEVNWLAALGAETLSAGRADAALNAIARVIRETLGVASCEIFARPAADTVGESGALPLKGRSSRDEAMTRVAVARATAAGEDATALSSSEMPAMVAWVADHGHPATEAADGTTRMLPHTAGGESQAPSMAPNALLGALDQGAVAYLLPLMVHGRTVGVLRLADPQTLHLDPTRRRYLDALAYYAALGVERVRLASEAERAEALREADRLKDSLVATVSHDLRTPLTTIRGLAHHIVAGDGDAGEQALLIEEEVDRLNRLVADLLDLSRLAAGGWRMRVAVNAADDLMGAALQRVDGIATRHTIQTTLDPDDPLLLGYFDLTQSIRIVVNLLENACKYAPTTSPIEFTVQREEGPTGAVLAFRVADAGPGVPPSERERIFAPFYRPPGVPPDVGSAGLGLAIARGLAEAQGGSLVYEPRVGGGSVFTLRVPAAELSSLG